MAALVPSSSLGPSSGWPGRLRSVVDVCDVVEDLPREAVGELCFDEVGQERRGIVFVERNRICWAAAPGLSRRLTDLLRQRAGARAGARTFEEVFQRCKATRAPLGETLVSAGIVTADELRGALRTHTVESLLAMSDGDARWHPRSQRGYDAQFTFSTGEICVELAARRHGDDVAELGRSVLASCLGPADLGFAYARTQDAAEPVPVAVWGASDVPSREVRQLGKWAAGVTDVAAALEDGAFRSVAHTNGAEGCSLAFRERGLLFVVLVDSRGLARVMSRRAQHARAVGG